MRHKPTVTQVTRHIVQAVAFVLMPGLFIQTFAALGSVVAAVARGSFSPGALASELALLAVVLGVTALWGRFFCGYLCSFGAMGDLAYAAASGLRPRGLRVSQRADGALKYVKFAVLAAIAVLCWCVGLGLWAGFDPWTPFGMLASGNLSGAVGIGLVTLVLVVAASTVVERFFCRYLCPLGAVFALVSRGRLFRIRRREDTCTGCAACTRSCSMGIVVHEGDRVRSGECVDCMRCLDACAPHSLHPNAKPAIAGAATALATMGLVYAGRIATDGTAYVQTTSSPTAQGSYKDGTYTGSGQGFRGTTSVTVTVSGGNITNIEVSSYEDDDQFFNQAKSTVIQEIIQSQGVDVDTVSGATFSSNGIISAVADALGIDASSAGEKDAASAGNASDDASSSNATSDSGTDTSSSGTTGSLDLSSVADGTYTGAGTGLRGQTQVQVSVAGGKITDIQILSYEDDAPYFERASSTMVSEILQSQSLDVDTVSGATFSSNGILEAVANAVGASFDNPNSTMTSGHGGHGH